MYPKILGRFSLTKFTEEFVCICDSLAETDNIQFFLIHHCAQKCIYSTLLVLLLILRLSNTTSTYLKKKKVTSNNEYWVGTRADRHCFQTLSLVCV